MKHSTNINQIVAGDSGDVGGAKGTSYRIRTSLFHSAIVTAVAPLAMVLCSMISTAPTSATSYSYSITYNDGIISNMPANTSASSYDENVPISSQTPTREGYEFLGWCNTLPTTTDGTDSCSGTTYSPGGNFVINQTTTANSLSLYTMWEKLITLADVTNMQDTFSCDATATGTTNNLTDSRDGQSYTVTKLADGKCWMTTNLNLAGGTVLSSDKSDVPSTNYYTLPASSTSGFSSDTTAYVYNSGNSTSTCSSPGCYSYYSWLAATAGGKNSSGSSVTTNGYNAAYSICPKGWRLPTSTTSNANAQTSPNWKTGDWYTLATAYGANLASNYYDGSSATGGKFYSQAGPGTTPNFLLAGYYGGGSFYKGGSDGYYWSSTALSSTNAYYLRFYSGYVSSASNGYRMYGYSVRCVYGE